MFDLSFITSLLAWDYPPLQFANFCFVKTSFVRFFVNNSINNWFHGFDLKHFRHILATSIFEHASTIEINNNKTLLEAMQSALAKVQHIIPWDIPTEHFVYLSCVQMDNLCTA